MNERKFNRGDYIRYTADNEQEVIDGLIGFGEMVAHTEVDPYFDKFVLLCDSWSRCTDLYIERENDKDRTKEFFSLLLRKNNLYSLPQKFYIDCGDRIEVREWLHDMGFRWCDDHSLILYSLDESVIYVDKVMSQCYIRVVDTQDYTLIKPKLTVTSFEVERTQSNENERSKEIEELKRLHDEIGERLDALLSR